MNNPETLTTLAIQDTGRTHKETPTKTQKTQKTKKMSDTDPTEFDERLIYKSFPLNNNEL